MQIIRSIDEMKECALALGNFDGLHRAHMKIINDCADFAHKNNIPGGVLLFENHTQTVLNGKDIMILTDFEEKCKLLKNSNIDFVFVLNFDDEFRKLSGKDFFKFLVNDLKAKALFAGYNYQFGYKALSTSEDLKKMGYDANIHISVVPEIVSGGKAISSTIIREYLRLGEVNKASELLGRPYSVSGKVVAGKQNGRKMGLPTANVYCGKNKLLPSDGVYFGYTEVLGERRKSLINVGKNPTFGTNNRTIESFIIDFDKEIYDKNITIEFCEKIRGEIKFSSPDELKNQIISDLKRVNELSYI